MTTGGRNGQGFVAGSLIGALGGLIGLGGAEFRLPVLVGVFRLGTLEAVILNKAMSLAVAGGELLIPAIVLLYGLDIKLAGSLSLMVSLPPMIVGFARYSRADTFKVLRDERPPMGWMAAGSILGAALGSLLLGLVPTNLLLGLLGIVLLVSAIKTFQYTH